MDLKNVIIKIKQKKYSMSNQMLKILTLLDDINVTKFRTYDDERILLKYIAKVINRNDTLTFNEIMEQLLKIEPNETSKFQKMLDYPNDNVYLKEITRFLDENRKDLEINPDIDKTKHFNLYILFLDLLTFKRVNQPGDKEDLSVLHGAIETDNVQMVKAFITNYELNLNFTNYYRENLLFYAVTFDSLEVFKLLLDFGLKLSKRNCFKETVLHKALYHKAYRCAKFITNLRRGIHRRDEIGNTPLHIAATNNLEIVKMLVERGGRLNQKNKNNETPILLAIRYQQIEIIRYLKQRRAFLSKRAFYYVAIFNVDKSFECIKEYKKHFRHFTTVDKKGITPLHIAAKHNSTKVGQLFIEYGINQDALTIDYASPLHFAVVHAAYEFTELLIKNKVDVNLIDINSKTPLHYAIQNKDDKMIALLVKAGANVNIKFKSGFTPMHYITGNNKLSLLKLIVQHGANVNDHSKEYVTPLCNAIYFNHLEMVKLLIEYGANVNDSYHGNYPLFYALKGKRSEIAQYLIEHGANINKEILSDMHGHHYSPLIVAIINKLDKVAELLILKGADVNARFSGDRTPLFLAIENGLIEIAKLLVLHGADLNIVNLQKETPLLSAIHNGYPDLATFFMEHGADVNFKIQTGFSVLIETIQKEYQDLAIELINRGVDINLTTAEGEQPIHYATRYKLEKVVELLTEKGVG